MKGDVPVNIAIQLLPLCNKSEALVYIDQAIELIKKSGIMHEVGPFETTLEGNYDEIMALVSNIKETILGNGATDIIINLKISASSVKLLSMNEKVKKYR